MRMQAIACGSASAPPDDGVGRQFKRLGAAAEAIASGQGDLVSSVVEFKLAETAARVNLAALARTLDTEETVLDVLA